MSFLIRLPVTTTLSVEDSDQLRKQLKEVDIIKLMSDGTNTMTQFMKSKDNFFRKATLELRFVVIFQGTQRITGVPFFITRRYLGNENQYSSLPRHR